LEGDTPEVEIETVPEQYEELKHPPQEPLSYVELAYYYTLNYFANPWAFLILLYIVYRLYRMASPYVSEPFWDWYYTYQEQKEAREEAARMKRNPEEYQAKMEAMETARLRMQERYNEDAVVAERRRQQKEEEKREQDIQDWESHQSGKGYKNRAGGKVDTEREALEKQARLKGKKGYARPDTYNPLMGDIGSSAGSGAARFRPAPRSTGGG